MGASDEQWLGELGWMVVDHVSEFNQLFLLLNAIKLIDLESKDHMVSKSDHMGI